MDLDYAGDLSPEQSWDILKKEGKSYLVDCRTSAEWAFVGVPDLESLKKKSNIYRMANLPYNGKKPQIPSRNK